MGSLDRVFRSRIAQGTAMGFYGLGVQILIQLVSVPLFTIHWGLGGYGVWLILFSVPSLLAMADFGLTTAGANTMVAAVAQGDRARACRIHGALRNITMIAASVLLAITVLILLFAWPHKLDLGSHFPLDEVRASTACLALYGALTLVNGVTLAGFRAADGFALGGAVYQTLILSEAALALATLSLGGGVFEVAFAYLFARLAGTAILALILRKHAPWLADAPWKFDLTEIRPLLKPAMAAFVFPIANIVTYHGSLVAIGVVAGAAAVPGFSVVRTISRTALQVGMKFNIASMPRFTVASAQGDHDRVADLVLLNLVVSALFVIPAAAVIVLLGQPIIALWTGHRVEVSLPLLAALAAAMLANAGWVPLSNLLLAINRHASFTYVMLAMSVLAVGLGAVLAGTFGALGMAIAIVALETAMSAWIWRTARRYKLVERRALVAAAARYIKIFRRARRASARIAED